MPLTMTRTGEKATVKEIHGRGDTARWYAVKLFERDEKVYDFMILNAKWQRADRCL